jgi:hypothetical protein
LGSGPIRRCESVWNGGFAERGDGIWIEGVAAEGWEPGEDNESCIKLLIHTIWQRKYM